jgi:thiol-disulfide isomerase/thioredoxin
MRPLRSPLLVAIAFLLAACATAPPAISTAPTDTSEPTIELTPSGPTVELTPSPNATDGPVADPLLAFELVDVRSGETFSLAELAADKPVLLETMAIWCTTCLSQQREVVRAHDLGDFHSVGIDVDPNERGTDLAAYADREGFDWRFAVADRGLAGLLTERFGFEVTNPPSTPTFVISDGTIRALAFGQVRSAEELIEELGAG